MQWDYMGNRVCCYNFHGQRVYASIHDHDIKNVVCLLYFDAVKLNDDKPMVLGKNNIINYIADSTLEIYLIQVIAKGIIQKNIVEPWNMFVFWDVALIGGVIVHRIYNVAIRKTVR